MKEVRKPIQKRSIEKKEAILKAGFDLFCENGYHKTNTIEIAKRAQVSTGAVYSYFKDKRDIYTAVFEQYLDSLSSLLFKRLKDTALPFRLSVFVEQWISIYVELYASSHHALMQLRMMMIEDESINQHFCDSEQVYILKIVEILRQFGVSSGNLHEKVYSASILVDALSREKSAFPHNSLDYDVLKRQMKQAILLLLSD